MDQMAIKSSAELLAQNVRRLRIDRGWSQMTLAERVGKPQSRISEIERAAFQSHISVIDELATVFGVDPAELLKDAE
jgi:transcriptional regulator with XRE-family HTH domain